MRILVLNGPNINLLGSREPDIYGQETYETLLENLQELAQTEGIEIDHFQSNHEGALVDRIQESLGTYDGLVINPAAYTHTSIAILDALQAVGLPTIEVHLSDINQREAFRQHSYVSRYAKATIVGQGLAGYRLAIQNLKAIIKEQTCEH